MANGLMPHLHTQYVIGYIPKGNEDQKAPPKISVKLVESTERKKHTVIAGPRLLNSTNRVNE